MFEGVCTALVTPFNKDGAIDFKSLDSFIAFQLYNNVDALLVAGTTGEPPTLEQDEKIELIKFVIKKVNKKVPVIVGCGGNNTKSSIQAAIKAEKLGADALLVVTPYYNKCTQEGLFQHFKAINDSVNIPIIAYNVPGRTGVNIQLNTLIRLSELKNIKGIKEASGNIDQISKICRYFFKKDFYVYSGDDSLTLPMLSLGAKGVISVASNIIPKQMHELVENYKNNNVKKSLEIHNKYVKLMDTLFIEVNPIPVKHACSLMNLMNNTLRLPLTSMEQNNLEILKNTMSECNLI